MSQIAAGYVVSSLMLQQVGRLAIARSSSKLWRMLRESAPAAQFEFSDSGYTVAVAIAYLEEQGIALPCRLPGNLAASPLETEYGLLICADAADSSTALDALATVTPLDDELRLYYEAFTEEVFGEAGAVMQRALSFIKRGLAQVAQPDEWLLVFVG